MFLQFLNPNNTGAPAVGFQLFTYLAGTSAKQATWTDSTQTVQNPNPMPLDSLGAGNLWGDPTIAYKFVWAPVNDTDPPSSQIRTVDNLYFPLSLAALTQQVLGTLLYPRTAAEIATSVMPVNFFYAAGIIDRYGTNTTPGTTNMNAAFAAALAQQQGGGASMQLLPETYLVTTNAVKTQNSQKPLIIFGVPFRSCIVNTAPASTPTIQLIDHQNFEISGIVFSGRSGFPNIAIELTSANGGSRSGYGQIRDCIWMSNGIGLHIAGLNDLVIDSCKYWPNAPGFFPGAPTNDGANALPAGISADTNGYLGWNPGEINHVFIRDFELGNVNATSATPPGAGILVDGSLNGSSTALNASHASTEWHIDGYDSGAAQLALYLRNCQYFNIENLYTTAIRLDNACVGNSFQSIFGNTITVDGTKTLGGCSRTTYISCVGSITADAANSITTHINCGWVGGDNDLSTDKRIIGGLVLSNNRTTDNIGGNGLCLGPCGAIQFTGTGGNALTIATSGATIIRLNPNANCPTTIMAKPTSPTATVDGCVVKVINLSAFTITMAVLATSFVADGASCVIPPLREMDFTFEPNTQLWYHT